MKIPETVEEAREQGYEIQKKTLDEAEAIMSAGTMPGLEATRPHRDCSTIPPNHKCWEGNCDASGWQEVLFCDGTQGCTIYAKVRCR